MNRGNCQGPIFQEAADHQRFAEILAEACAKTNGQVHALGLIEKPLFRLAVETPQGNLVAA